MPAALDGVRVIDFGQYLPGPLATMLLADAGADVIRVDPPGGPLWQHHANSILQRGKRSIILDLKNPSDHQIAQRLIASADVVVENFSPGVMDRLSLGASACCEANPRRGGLRGSRCRCTATGVAAAGASAQACCAPSAARR